MASVKLNVPYRSQWDQDAKDHETDCGPTCAAMILNAYGIEITPDSFYSLIDKPKGRKDFTNFAELMGATKKKGITMEWKSYVGQGEAWQKLKENVDGGKPMIALVRYQTWRSLTGNQFSGGHFVVVVGYDDQNVYMNDPLFGLWATRSKGDHYMMPVNTFLGAWGGFPVNENPNFACAIVTQSLNVVMPTPTPTPAPTPQPTPPVTPAPVITPSGEVPAMTPEVRRRIMALAAMLRAVPPDLDTPEDAEFWGLRLGDWGAAVQKYTVVSGDTLGGISGRVYGDMSKWRGIRAFNNLPGESIWVGQRLEIPLKGNTELPTDFIPDPSAISFSVEEEPEAQADAQSYDDFDEMNAGFNFAEGLEE